MTYYNNTELYHHGIKGQKWGVRRFQNKDGSLTPAGEKRIKGGDVKPTKSSPKAASKEGFSKFEKDYDSINRLDAKALKKIEAQEAKELDDAFKARTGMDRKTCLNKAYEQNQLIDSGKLKWKKSLWPVIAEVEDPITEKYTSIKKEAGKPYAEKKLKLAEEYADNLMKESKLSTMKWSDVQKYSKKVFYEEAQEWDDSWGVYALFDELNRSEKLKGRID